MSRRRVLLRCDARPHEGIGHLVRCVAVAEATRARGWSAVMAGRMGPSLLADRLLSDAGLVAEDPGETGARGLARLAALHGADVVHVDHYDLPQDLRQVLSRLGVLLSNVEDGAFGRRPADITIDASPGAESLAGHRDGGAVVLMGLKFALLRESVLRARQVRESRAAAATGSGIEILLVLGGSDAAGALGEVTSHVLAAIEASGATVRLTVVDPSARRLSHERHGMSALRRMPPVGDLPRLAAGVDLVVSAAGSTMWELVAIGVPMAVVCVAANQEIGYAAVVGPGCAIGLGAPGALAGGRALARELAEWEIASVRRPHMNSLVDGRGAQRLTAAWDEALPRPRWRSRLASASDSELLLSWRNDELTRRWSRSTAEVEREDHLAWLIASLERRDRRLLVVELDGVPIGTVRWDQLSNLDWEVSITVDPDSRGRGVGACVLAAGERWLEAWVGDAVGAVAWLRPENQASARLFAGCGYERTPELDKPPVLAHRRWLSANAVIK